MLKTRSDKLIVFSLIAITFILMFLFIPTGDDWAWGSQLGIDRLTSFFKDYNGRYISNLFVLLLTRSNLIRILVESLVIIGIVYLIDKIAKLKSINNLLLGVFLLLAMPKNIITQTIAWTSGYTNYIIPVIGILFVIYLFFEDKKIFKTKNINYIAIFALGIFNSLFMENVTLYNLILSVFMLGYTYFKTKKLDTFYLIYFISSLLGSIIMFSNGAYNSVISAEDSYRSINGIKSILSKFFNQMHYSIFMSNLVVNIVIAMALCKLYFGSSVKKIDLLSKLSISFCVFYVIYSFIRCISPEWRILSSYTHIFEGLISCVWALSILILTLKLETDKRTKEKLIFLLASIVVLCLPLIVVNPIGPRCYFIIYILYIMYILILSKDIITDMIKTPLIIMCLTYSLFHISIYFNNYYNNSIRMKELYEQIEEGKNVVYLYRLHYRSYVHNWNIESYDFLEERFKMYYNIDEKVDIEVVNKNEYFNKIKNKN